MPTELSRYAWVWDHTTNWTPAVHGRQTIGTNNPYLKDREVFLSDFRRLLDFLGRKQFAGLCVWGLLRQSHGGVEAAREIVAYGRERSVSVTPGVGLYTYGGAFYEGRHEFNLETFALANPQCAALVRRKSDAFLALRDVDVGTRARRLEDAFLRRRRPWVQLCPSDPQVIAWIRDAVSWVIEALDLRTIMLEGGDVFNCQCDKCLQRRKRTIDRHVSLEDLCAGYVPVVEYLHRHHPDVEIQCETYGAPGIAPAGAEAGNGKLIPEDCIAQIEAIPEPAQLQLAYNYIMPDEQLNLPTSIARRGLLRTELGSQWQGPNWPHCCAQAIARHCRACRKLGIPAVSFFTEAPDSIPSHWINYEALHAFTSADIDYDTFVERDIAPRLGGIDRAREFIDWATDPKRDEPQVGLTVARQGAVGAADEQEFLKWAWLGGYIAEFGRAGSG